MSLSDDDEVRELRIEIERLKARLAEIEPRVAAVEARTAAARAATPHQKAAARREPRKAAFETRFGLTLLNRIGVITLILGAAFFFKYAVENEWVGPGARVALGLAAALAALWFGDCQRRRDERLFGNGVTGLGGALLFVSF